MAFFQLYENSLLANNVAVFNYALFGGIAQLAGLVAAGLAGVARRWRPSAGTAVAGAVLAEAGMAAQLLTAQPAANLFGALACGIGMSLLAVTWGVRISTLSPRTIFLFVLAALLGSTALCFVCFAAQDEAPAICTLLLPIASGALYVNDKRKAADDADEESLRTRTAAVRGRAKARRGTLGARTDKAPMRKAERATANPGGEKRAVRTALPWSFLVILTACCLLSSFFVGVTMNPYIFQSVLVSRYMHLFTLLAFSGLLVCALVVRRPQVQLFFIAALALLLIGLFLLSAGVLGSIIMPLGLVLAAKNCCFALCWITFAVLAKTSRMAPCALFGFGLALCNGTLGRSAGMMTSNGAAPSFPDIALAASLCIVAFALFYALTITSHSCTGQTIEPDFADAFSAEGQSGAERTKRAAGGEPTGRAASAEGVGPKAADPKAADPKAAGTASSPARTAQLASTSQARKLEGYNLTAQELRIAEFVLQGKTYREIAALLEISERTVKFHAKNAYRKAGVESKIDFLSKMLSGN